MIITSILLVICYNIDHGLLLLFLSLIAILFKQIDIHRNFKKTPHNFFLNYTVHVVILLFFESISSPLYEESSGIMDFDSKIKI
jgi:hypothetical protein